MKDSMGFVMNHVRVDGVSFCSIEDDAADADSPLFLGSIDYCMQHAGVADNAELETFFRQL